MGRESSVERKALAKVSSDMMKAKAENSQSGELKRKEHKKVSSRKDGLDVKCAVVVLILRDQLVALDLRQK
jgi:hypothetical protein